MIRVRATCAVHAFFLFMCLILPISPKLCSRLLSYTHILWIIHLQKGTCFTKFSIARKILLAHSNSWNLSMAEYTRSMIDRKYTSPVWHTNGVQAGRPIRSRNFHNHQYSDNYQNVPHTAAYVLPRLSNVSALQRLPAKSSIHRISDILHTQAFPIIVNATSNINSANQQ